MRIDLNASIHLDLLSSFKQVIMVQSTEYRSTGKRVKVLLKVQSVKTSFRWRIREQYFGGVDRVNSRMTHPTIIHALLENSHVVNLPGDSICTNKVLLDKMNVDRLLRNNRHSENDSDGLVSLEASIQSLEREIKASLREQRVMIKTHIRGSREDTTEKIKEVKAILTEMKEDAVTWWRYEKERDDVMRSIWMKDNPEVVKSMPKFPIGLLWQSRDKRPTHHE